MTEFEHLVETLPDGAEAEAIGALERHKAMLYARLVTAMNGPAPPAAGNADDQLMTPEEVADYINDVDVSWVYRHADKLGAIRPTDRCLRFRRSLVDRHLDRCRHR